MPILVTNNFPPQRGGIQTLMARLAECLVERAHAVNVVAPGEKGSAAYDASAPYPIIRYFARRRPGELFAIAFAYLRTLRVARERVTIASVWWPVAFAIVLVPRRLRGPLAILVHGTEVSPKQKGLRQKIMRAVFARAEVVIANSSYTRNLLVEAGVAGNIKVVTLGVDMRDVAPARAHAPTVLSVGRLVARKGFDRVIGALPSLLAEFPDLRYEIVGSGPQRAELEALAQGLGVAQHVVFRGSVSDGELHEAYARAWCFALPVRNIDDDVEGFGIVYLEAAMASLPSIGGLESGASDAIVDGHTGLLVDGRSAPAVAEAIGTLFRNREWAEAMGRNGFERARGLTWMRTTEQILAALASEIPAFKRT